MIDPRNPWKPDPSRLYSWDVEPRQDGPITIRQGGVTDDRDAALARVQNALQDAPVGACGQVRRVALSMSRQAVYLDLGMVAQARRTGRGVSWL